MFLGHYGVAFGLKKAAPQVPLAVLFIAAGFIDLLWPAFLLFGWERVAIVPGITRVTPLDFVHYPFSHSLGAVALWSLAFALVYWAVARSRRGAVIVGLAVMSHWVLDLIVHRPDLPLGLGEGVRVGLGLWNYPLLTYGLEFGFLFAGLYLYARATAARDRIGRLALAGLVVTLVAIYGANVFGPPPPSVAMIGYAGHALWLFVIWAYWIDRHRTVNP